MCGITGIVGQRNICGELFEGMQNLEYRGYDSAGMAVLDNGRLEVRKDAGTLAEVEGRQRLSTMSGSVGIAHTRWATHGGVCQANAHPHSSPDGCFAFARYTHQAVFLNDDEYAVLRPHDYTIKSLRTAATLTRAPAPIARSNGHLADKRSYPHFMLKEIHQGADCVETALAVPKAEIAALTQR